MVVKEQAIPTVIGDTLVSRDGQVEDLIIVGTPPWRTWLATAAKFTFTGPAGTFTAFKESRGGGRSYWRAYRRRAGTLRRAYLGTEDQITPAQLNAVAAALAGGEGDANTDEACYSERALSPYAPSQTAVVARTPGSSRRSPHHSRRDHLLAAKLGPPVIRSDLVTRPHLVESLSQGLLHRLSLLSAPAGFGKTTLLGQWIRVCPYRVAWLSLDAADNDPTRFWAYVVAALQTVRRGIGADALDLLRSAHASADSFLALLCNDIAAGPRDLVLVIDDYHLISNPAIHSGVAFLIDHAAPRLHVIVATRADPPLPLATLRGRGQLMELRAAELRFSSAEADTLLNEIMGLGVSRREVGALEERTEGWVAGLQMAAISMRSTADISDFVRNFSGDHRHITDYMLEMVLNIQPPEVQNFLFQTSILERLSGPLCGAVTGLGDSRAQTMLEHLERANLFTVPLDDERHWYRYHSLFADCLAARMYRMEPDRGQGLHRRASAWYAEQGLVPDAFRQAMAAHDLDGAVSLVEHAGWSFLERGEVAILIDLLKSLPENILRQRPLAATWYAYALVGTGQLDAADAWLQDAGSCLASLSAGTGDASLSGLTDLEAQRTAIRILAVRATVAGIRRDLPRAIDLASQASALLAAADGLSLDNWPEGAKWRGRLLHDLALAHRWSGDVVRAGNLLVEACSTAGASGNIMAAVCAASELASVQVAQGRLRQAESSNQAALRLSAQHGKKLHPAAAWPHIGLALLHYEWNDLGTSDEYARQGVALARQAGLIDILILGHSVLARLKLVEGDSDGALQSVGQHEELARQYGLIQELDRIAAFRARVSLARGDLATASRWARESGLRADDEVSYLREFGHLTLARVLIAEGRPAEAASLLGRLSAAAEAAQRLGSVIGILGVLALALEAHGEPGEALAALSQALGYAEKEGYVRSFVDNGPPMTALLARLVSTRTERFASRMQPGYASALLSAFGARGGVSSSRNTADPRIRQPFDPLSERECAVLHLIAEGLNSAQIARRLIVSPNTVKTHYRNIYDKLGSHSRAEVLAKARTLQLL